MPWLHVVGLGEDGLAGLAPAARGLVMGAEVLVGGARHHRLTEKAEGERIAWPSPWDAMLGVLEGLRGRRVVVLVTGDPLWFSGGERIVAAFPGEVAVHPHPGAFQMAAARMGWSLDGVECLTAHGRPVGRVLPHLAPGARWLVLVNGPETAGELARLLVAQGWGSSRVVALSHLGGPGEARVEGTAGGWSGETPALCTLAVECIPGPGARVLGRTGLPDEAFESDGTMTKREVRSATLAKLVPLPGQMLWDVGLGSGSVAIEWMRAAKGARAVGVEPRADRRALAAANALALGVPGLEIVAGEAPAALEGLPAPDAVFLGGGLSEAAFEAVWAALRPGGRLVANAVTLEAEAVMLALHRRHGGELVRIAVSRAEPVGRLTGWRPAMEVMQWSLRTP
ncbi:precorrin-6y C5,15-methyltransferase (decarboxylating) subunit CbiE [Rubellimicrobium aerolatum]|uniref:Precorrin-6y C5,15-methyltransferase (Decarboxylating) subunit CbiE n=1 Tax=Rubellimicrobium aerolatum TaxID=490979 RepID=A0ABW0SD08_9RHOB|nr:precorrin-6y C5,15-methyltransferase (decarboxylating) subunit CbiE [Rubellimicrobium aerolatum]MBP1806704.1 precorrin-6Y C5,15-methyltransferase (decarboxylating) [Rubellimicrobium aerolatum]